MIYTCHIKTNEKNGYKMIDLYLRSYIILNNQNFFQVFIQKSLYVSYDEKRTNNTNNLKSSKEA